MRVIGGIARGRPLRPPRGGATRPTSDRVREAVFDMLSSMDRLEDSSVLDLFAGSGALGIECISRGARSAVLVDWAPEAIAAIRQNVAVLGPDSERATVVKSDAIAYLAKAPTFDLVLADPPYGFERWAELFERLNGRAGLLVAETSTLKEAVPWVAGAGWETVKVKRYGGTVVSIAQPVPEGDNYT